MHTLHRSAVALTLVVFASLTLAASHARADTRGADIVGYVNAQRATNGIPAGIVEDTAASAACAMWIASGEHDAGPVGEWSWRDTPPAYEQGPWTATNDPFESHPDELQFVLAPRLASFGAAVINGQGCATIDSLAVPGTRPAPAHDVTYTYPGDGAQDVRTSQLRDDELQPQGRFDEIGPVMFALFDGPDLDPAEPSATQVSAASLTGPGGAPVPFAARSYPTPCGVTQARLVPRAALAPFTTYHASVIADVTPPGGGAARSFTKAWSFTTGALENQIAIREYSDLTPDHYETGTWTLVAGSRAPRVTMTATKGSETITQTATSQDYWTAGATFTVPLSAGVWKVCYSSGGPGTDYRAASTCQSITSVGPPAAPVSPPASVDPPVVHGAAPRPVALVVSVPKGAKAKRRGRTLTVAGVRCSAACALRVEGKVRAGGETIKLVTAVASRKSAGTVTIKYMLPKAAAQRLRGARASRLALTIVPKGGAIVRKTVAIGAK